MRTPDKPKSASRGPCASCAPASTTAAEQRPRKTTVRRDRCRPAGIARQPVRGDRLRSCRAPNRVMGLRTRCTETNITLVDAGQASRPHIATMASSTATVEEVARPHRSADGQSCVETQQEETRYAGHLRSGGRACRGFSLRVSASLDRGVQPIERSHYPVDRSQGRTVASRPQTTQCLRRNIGSRGDRLKAHPIVTQTRLDARLDHVQ